MGNAFHKAPLLRIGLVLILGILFGDWLGAYFPLWTGLVVAGSLLLASLVLETCKVRIEKAMRKSVQKSLLVLLSILFFGFYLVAAKKARGNLVEGGERTYEAIVSSPPATRGKTLRFEAWVVSARKPFALQVSLLRDTLTGRYRQLHLGSGFMATSAIETEPHREMPSTFVYHRNWRLTPADDSSLSVVQRARLRLMMFRERLLAKLRQTGEGNDEAVVAAMVLGDKSGLSRQLRDEYSVSGASHVLALSGLHLGIIYFFLTLVFFRTRWRLLGQVAVLPVIWLFVLMVGGSPSVVRAATMLTVYASIELLRRKAFTLNTLALAAIIMLVANPLSLWDISFQLSFLAVLGIQLFFKPIYRMLSELVMPSSDQPFVLRLFTHDRRYVVEERKRWGVVVVKWLLGMVAVSIATQLTTAPLVAHYFGRFSCYFLLTNLIAVPLATIILYASLVFFMLSFIPQAQALAGQFVMSCSSLLNKSLSFISSLPGASVEGIQLSSLQTALIYVLLITIIAIVQILLKTMAKSVFLRMR